MKHRPLRIGVSARLLHHPPRELGFRGKTLQYLEQSAAHWVMSHGAMAFMIPTLLAQTPQRRSMVTAAHYAENLDGLLLQGGADVDPRSYGEEPLRPEWAGDRVRDRYELSLLRAFIEQGKPVLGICRGMQLINVALGGSLYQDIATEVAGASAHQTADYDRHVHEVRFSAGGLLARLWPEHDGGGVVSIHHQAVRALGRDLEVEAVCPHDGLVEAIRGKGRGFLLGVQWHPEFHHPGDAAVLDMTPLLDAFIEAARKRRW